MVSYAATLPSVDSRRIVLWGLSLGATISACAAAIDRRIAAVLMVCPIFKFIRPDRRAKAFAALMRDRTSQLRGNEPFMLQPFNSEGENLAGYAGSGGPGGKEAYSLMSQAVERGHPNFRDRITLQSYHKMALFRPEDLLDEMLEKVPVMMMVPELDDISLTEDQEAAFHKFKTPKTLYKAKGRGHMSILTGEGSREVHEVMVSFFNSALAGEIE